MVTKLFNKMCKLKHICTIIERLQSIIDKNGDGDILSYSHSSPCDNTQLTITMDSYLSEIKRVMSQIKTPYVMTEITITEKIENGYKIVTKRKKEITITEEIQPLAPMDQAPATASVSARASASARAPAQDPAQVPAPARVTTQASPLPPPASLQTPGPASATTPAPIPAQDQLFPVKIYAHDLMDPNISVKATPSCSSLTKSKFNPKQKLPPIPDQTGETVKGSDGKSQRGERIRFAENVEKFYIEPDVNEKKEGNFTKQRDSVFSCFKTSTIASTKTLFE